MHSDTTNLPLYVDPARGVTLSQLDRWTSLAAAVGLSTYGLPRRDAEGLAAAAVLLVYRTISGEWPASSGALRSGRSGWTGRSAWGAGDAGNAADEEASDATRRALGGDRGFVVHEAIRLEMPIGAVYLFWRQLENLPRFMSHLATVTQTDSRRSHWVARGPGGVLVEWDAEIINEVENQVIGWQSLPGSDVVVAGSVNFDEVRGGSSTQVTVRLQYAPPAGRVGSLVSMLAGREPSQTIREDLRRLKQILEAGEVAQR